MLAWGCTHHTTLRPDLIIDKTKMETLVAIKDTTFIFFWAQWNEASNIKCSEDYLPLATKLAKHARYQVILIAADATVPESEILAHRSAGIKSYYLHNPGTYSLFNRLRIKSFLTYCFPNNNLPCIDGFTFALPQLMYHRNQLESTAENVTPHVEKMQAWQPVILTAQ